jgi:Dienelactone hydrolase and related enzymes
VCFDLDSLPPIRPLAGAETEARSVTLHAGDGASFRAFHARPATPTGKAIIILPDTRGLHHYYEELAQRFAEIGVEAIAIDYFGRTAGLGTRDDKFEYMPHVSQTTWAGISADFKAAAEYLRSEADRPNPAALFSIGFCMGGRNAFMSATLGQQLSGAIGFYGFPGGAGLNDTPAPLDAIDKFGCPVLGIFGGADQAIPVATVQQFRDALEAAGIEQEIVVEPDAPHSFFDKKAVEYQAQAEDAWARVRRFIENHGTN